MSTSRLIRHSLRSLARFRMRSGFMMLGTFIGIAALTLILSVGRGAERKIMNTVRQLFGSTSLLVMAGNTQFMGGPRPNTTRLTIDDLEAVAREVPDVEAWDPQLVMPGAAVRAGERSTTARVMGASERFEHVWQRAITRGEPFEASAVAATARVALVGETVARELFPDRDPVGAEILIGSVAFQVIGVLEGFGTDLHGMDRDAEIVVPISTMMRRVMNMDTITAARVLIKDQERSQETADAIRAVLRERHARAEGQPDDFGIITPVFIQGMVERSRRTISLYLPLAAGIALVVGACVASSLMLASVNERVAEIGLRRAVGARPRDIRTQFLVETVVILVCGGLAGMAVGYAGAAFAASRMSLDGIFSWQEVLVAVSASAGTGLLAGILPARRAARLQPADALR